jgi:hypothetical protein
MKKQTGSIDFSGIEKAIVSVKGQNVLKSPKATAATIAKKDKK